MYLVDDEEISASWSSWNLCRSGGQAKLFDRCLIDYVIQVYGIVVVSL